jgi:hypothetical protein
MGRYLDLIAASKSCEISELSQGGVLFSHNSQMQPGHRGDFHAALCALDARCPEGVHDHGRWRQAVADGNGFLAQWGEQALLLDWTVDDLFGLHPIAPLARYDAMGLVWLLLARPVVALSEKSAAIENVSGAISLYRRYNKPAFGPVGDSLDDFQ